MIPKIIHYIFLSKTEKPNPLFPKFMKKTKNMHPGWEIKTYNEDDAQRILFEHFPLLLPTYNNYQHYVQRADFLRVILVYLYGGFYMDMDMFCLKNLNALLEFKLVLAEERTILPVEKLFFERNRDVVVKHRMEVGNYMFGSESKHPFWLYLIRMMVNKSIINIETEGDILETTGPLLLTSVYHMYKKKFPEILLLRNLDRHCINQFDENEVSCHFGNYAAHVHTGTWRWQSIKNKVIIDQFQEGKNKGELETFFKKILPSKINNSFIIKVENPQENLPLSLYQIYNELSKKYSYAEEYSSTGNTLIYFGDPLKLNIGNYDTKKRIILTDAEFIKTEKAISVINDVFQICLISGIRRSSFLKKYELKIPFFLIEEFYLFQKRNFAEQVIVSDKFRVGVFCSNICDYYFIEDLLKQLKDSDRNIIFSIFYTQRPLGFVNLMHIDLINLYKPDLSTELQALSCFLSFQKYTEETKLVYTNLYFGTPVITKHQFLSKEIRKYCKSLYRDDIVDVSKEIISLGKNYSHYNSLAIEGSVFVEDTFSIDSAINSVVNHIMKS